MNGPELSRGYIPDLMISLTHTPDLAIPMLRFLHMHGLTGSFGKP